MIDDQEIARLRELCEKAEPGPWRAHQYALLVVELDDGDGFICDMQDLGNNMETAAFIADARTALPALLDEVTRLRAHITDDNNGVKQIAERVIAFASQLEAWGHEAAAQEILTEILGGHVNAPDYYAQKAELERERARAEAAEGIVKSASFWLQEKEITPEIFTRRIHGILERLQAAQEVLEMVTSCDEEYIRLQCGTGTLIYDVWAKAIALAGEEKGKPGVNANP